MSTTHSQLAAYDFQGRYEAEPVDELAKLISAGYVINLAEHATRLEASVTDLGIELLEYPEVASLVTANIDLYFPSGKTADNFKLLLLNTFGCPVTSFAEGKFEALLARNTFGKHLVIQFVNGAMEDIILGQHDSKPLMAFATLIEHDLLDPVERAYLAPGLRSDDLLSLKQALEMLALALEAESDTDKLRLSINGFIETELEANE